VKPLNNAPPDNVRLSAAFKLPLGHWGKCTPLPLVPEKNGENGGTEGERRKKGQSGIGRKGKDKTEK